MIKKIKTQAFVLKKKTLLDKNLLITFFSQDLGKINVLTFGARKIISRRLIASETGNFVEIIIHLKDNFFYLKEVRLINGFYQLKSQSQRLHYLYLTLFTLDRILPQNQPEKEIFISLISFLNELSHSKNKFLDSKVNFFLLKLLKRLGFIDKKFFSLEETKKIIENIIEEKIPFIP